MVTRAKQIAAALEENVKAGKPLLLGLSTEAPCSYCHRKVQQLYMVHDAIWERAGVEFVENLHIGCLERILKRRLNSRDFYYQDRATGVRR